MLLHSMIVAGLALARFAILMGGWLGWQLLRQNGRILLRLDELEKRLGELELGNGKEAEGLSVASDAPAFELQKKPDIIPVAPASATPAAVANNGDGRAARFSNRSLTQGKVKRDGLKTGTVAPEFRLPRLDGRGDLALSDLRGHQVLLVFSSPGCGPCNALAPELEKLHHEHPELEVVMISKGEPKENRAKVKEFGLTFPIVLQQQWEISRRYAMFATPVAYLIDEAGVLTSDVAVGVEAILDLASANNESLVRS